MRALKRVSLEVRAGETLVVLGPNGAGKTTLLKIMAGLIKPDSGQLFYRGSPVDGSLEAQLRRKVTMVFQRTVLFNTTVFENVAYGLKVRGLPKPEIEERAWRVLERVGLGELAFRRVKSLSGGEQRKLSLAMALILKPEILLLDEPTVNLDPQSASFIEKLVKDMRGDTSALVVSTHNLFQARRLADRLAVLSQGRLVEVGEASQVFSNPSHPEAAAFLRGETFY